MGILHQRGAPLPHSPACDGDEFQLCDCGRWSDCGVCLGMVVGWREEVSLPFAGVKAT